jgi:hypothetical protein
VCDPLPSAHPCCLYANALMKGFSGRGTCQNTPEHVSHSDSPQHVRFSAHHEDSSLVAEPVDGEPHSR